MERPGRSRSIPPPCRLTRLANSIIDGVAVTPQPVAAEVEKYLGTDLLFYRAAEPDGLVVMQREHWDPVLAWAARRAWRALFTRRRRDAARRNRPQALVRVARTAIPTEPWRLGAVNVVTTLTGSALLALALAAGRINVDQAGAAAHVDEDWNMQFWGRDELALQRRSYRFAENGRGGAGAGGGRPRVGRRVVARPKKSCRNPRYVC